MACVALSDIQSAFACVANMAPAFLVVLLGAVDVAAAAAALTSTFLLCFTVTTDVTDCVMRPARPPLVTIVPLSGSHSPFCNRRGGDIHAAAAPQPWHRLNYVFPRYGTRGHLAFFSGLFDI